MSNINTVIRNILLQVQKVLDKQEDIQTAYNYAENTGQPMDSLVVRIDNYGLLDSVFLNVYYLVPMDSTDLYFECIMTISEDIEHAMLADIFSAIMHINSILPFGSFNYNPINLSIDYKLNVPVNNSISDSELAEQTELLISHALDMAEKYAYLFSQLAKGEINLDTFLQIIPSSEEE